LLTTALVSLDLFSWLHDHPSNRQAICQYFEIKERPTDVMLTLFTAMGFLQAQAGVFNLTQVAREHLVKSSPWFLGPYYASLKDRPVCQDFLRVLRTDKPANWGSLKDEKAWAQAMEDSAFAQRFTSAMDCRGIFLGPAMAKALDLRGRQSFLDIAVSVATRERFPSLLATCSEMPCRMATTSIYSPMCSTIGMKRLLGGCSKVRSIHFLPEDYSSYMTRTSTPRKPARGTLPSTRLCSCIRPKGNVTPFRKWRDTCGKSVSPM